MRKTVNIIVYILFTCISLQAQIVIQKIEVIDSARINIEWDAPWTPNTNACEVWRGIQNTANFTKIAEFANVDKHTYSDTNLKTNSVHYSYFVKLRYKDGTYSHTSDTLSSIVLFGLSENQQGISDGIAYLHWNYPIEFNSMDANNLGMQFPFMVERSAANMWLTIDSLSSSIYRDSLYVCDSVFAYRIVFKDKTTKVISNIVILNIKDIEEPHAVIFDSISVDNANGQIVLGWQTSASDDVTGYVILKMQGVSLRPIDTVWGRWDCFYSDKNGNPKLQEQYRVQAVDHCFNGSLFIEKRSVLIESLNLPSCADSIEITWSKHRDMIDSVASFEILHAFEGDTFANILRVEDGHANGAKYPVFTQNGWHKFIVRARNKFGVSSTALCDSLLIDKAVLPTLLYLRKVDQKENGEVLLSVYIDTIAIFKGISVYRQESEQAKNIWIAEIPEGRGQQNYTYIDKTANANKGERFYTLILQDTCSRNVLQSQTCNTIYLQRKMINGQQIQLYWNAYQGWGKLEYEYIVYRKNKQNSQVEVLTEIPSQGTKSTYEYIDTRDAGDDWAQWSYYVEAVQNLADILNPFDFRDTVKSNEIKALQDGSPIFYMPNAFNPKGRTSEYKPIGIFLSSDIFVFRIFDRWGKMIFESTNTEYAWDGKYKGTYVVTGVYVYIVSVIRSGEETKMTGTVTVI